MNNEKFTAGPIFLYKGISYKSEKEMEQAKKEHKAKEVMRDAAPDMYEVLDKIIDNSFSVIDEIDENDAREMQAVQDLLSLLVTAKAVLFKANPSK